MQVAERMNSRAILILAAAGVAGLICAGKVHGASYTYLPNNNTTDNDTNAWNNTLRWSQSPNTGFPNAAGDVADMNVNVTAASTIRVNTNAEYTIGTLNIGDADASTPFAVAIAARSGFTPTLTFQSDTAGGATSINNASPGTTTNTISVPIKLGGTSPLTISQLGTQNLSISGGMILNGNTLTLGGAGAGGITIGGSFTGSSSSSIVKNNVATLTANNNFSGYSGSITVNRGTLAQTTGSLATTSEMIVNGAITSTGAVDSANILGGNIEIGSGSTVSVNPGQRLSSTAITFNSGFFNNRGTPYSASPPANTLNADTVGTVKFNSGYSLWFITHPSTASGTNLTATAVVRNQGATLNINSAALGTNAKVLGDFAKFLKGTSNGDAANDNTPIIPWLAAETGQSNTAKYSPNFFASFDSTNGIKTTTTADYATTLSGTADRNVNVTSMSLGTGVAQTVNSLRNNATTDTNIGSGSTLTVSSGGVIFVNTGGIGVAGNSAAGTLAFGDQEGVIWSYGGRINTIGSAVTGSGGLTKAGVGTVILAGANTYGGTTTVSAGVLRVGNGTQTSTLGTSNVSVANGGVLQISSADSILDSKAVSLDAFGLQNGKLLLDANMVEQVAALTLGGITLPDGYYGSSAAVGAGANAGFNVNSTLPAGITADTFFDTAGSGVIHVVAVPEPATIGLLAVGGFLALRRRRSEALQA
jgi:autotransporter-associated beta strand protein